MQQWAFKGGAVLLCIVALTVRWAEALSRLRPPPVASLAVQKVSGSSSTAKALWTQKSGAAAAVEEEEAEEERLWSGETGFVVHELEELQEAALRLAALDVGAQENLGPGRFPVAQPSRGEQPLKLLEPKKPLVSTGQESGSEITVDQPSVSSVAPSSSEKGGAGSAAGKGLVKEAALVPMLKMLRGLYEQGRARIVKLNKEEREQKEKFSKHELEHKARIARIEARFGNHTLSAEQRANETRDENRIFGSFERARERHHKRYLNLLRIQHVAMERTKRMIEMYEKTLAGKKQERSKVKYQLSSPSDDGAAPEVVLLREQVVRSVLSFCKEALGEVKRGREEELTETE